MDNKNKIIASAVVALILVAAVSFYVGTKFGGGLRGGMPPQGFEGGEMRPNGQGVGDRGQRPITQQGPTGAAINASGTAEISF